MPLFSLLLLGIATVGRREIGDCALGFGFRVSSFESLDSGLWAFPGALVCKEV